MIKEGEKPTLKVVICLKLKPNSCLLALFCSGGVFIAKGCCKVLVELHRHGGVFIAMGKEDDICTMNWHLVKPSTKKT